MNVIFEDDALRELYEYGKTKDKRYKKFLRDKKFLEAYTEVVNTMRSVDHVKELRFYSFLHYEQLRHRPESSVRIQNGRVERLIFIEREDGVEIRLIEIDRTHYGNK